VNTMSSTTSSEAAKAVVHRNNDEVQGSGKFDVFEELFADDFVDHTPPPDMTPDKTGVRKLYGYLRTAFSRLPRVPGSIRSEWSLPLMRRMIGTAVGSQERVGRGHLHPLDICPRRLARTR